MSVRREEFDAVYERLGREGLDIGVDPEQAWADFVAARVQYDEVLLALAALTMAPPAPWSSDRALRTDESDPLLSGAERRGSRLSGWRRRVTRNAGRPRRSPRTADPTALDGEVVGDESQGKINRGALPTQN